MRSQQFDLEASRNSRGCARLKGRTGFLAVLIAFTIAVAPVLGADEETVGTPWRGEPGITETVDQIMQRDALLPPTERRVRVTHPEIESGVEKQANPLAPEVSQWPPLEGAAAAPESVLSPQPVGVSFTAMLLITDSDFIPPDSMGDVGPTQIMVVVNGSIKVFSKTGVLGPLNTSTDNFFQSVRNNQGTTDPHIRYDRLSGRWFVTMVNTAGTDNRIMIAVSSGPTITGTSSFTYFFFQQNTGGGGGTSDNGRFADYPTLGVDRFALYIGANMFGTVGQADTTAWVVNKASVMGPGPIVVTAFRGLTAALTAGPISPQGVDNDDPSATEGYIIGVDAAVFSRLVIRRVSNPGGTPTLSGNLNLTVPTTDFPLDQVALASIPMDALDDRLFAAEIHKNKITGAITLWTAHNIAVTSAGVGSAAADRNGSRWYEIGNLTTTPTLVQSGTLFDSAAANPRGYWMESVAGSGQGHMALGSSFASASEFAGVAVAGRLRTNALGTTAAPTIALTGVEQYNEPDTAGRNRWGDYSQTVVDPTDDMTMWTFQEYADDDPIDIGVWGVRVVQLIAPPPATPSAAVPSFVPRNTASTLVTVTGTSVSGSEFFDPGTDTGGPGYANHIAASVSGGVSLNGSATFNSPTQVTLNVSTVGATCSTKDVTVTNPDAQARTGPALLTTIPPAPTASNNGPICAGSTLNLTASSTVPGVTFSWTGPNGFASTQQNPSIPNATTAASGAYMVTVSIGGCSSAPATTTATVNPTPAPPTASNNGPICAGATLDLSASTVAGATYAWTGPNGFASTQQNPSIPNATTGASGTYSVTATVGGCTSSAATTTATVNADGASCNDADACTTNDACTGGSCAGQPVICTALDQCHVAGTCDPGTGVCSNPAAPDGTVCSDGSACTTDDACSEGTCLGFTLRCDDFNDCTSNSCNPQSGCVYTPLNNGTLCSDHNTCTVNDACSSGVCDGTPIVVPSEVTNLLLTDDTTLVWDSAGGAGPGTVHDVARGLVGEFPVGSGASETCLASGLPGATTSDTDTPALGDSFWYLVRGRNSCGTGTYGFQSNGTPRETSACP